MVGFPRLPLIHGETDDEASIHIHRHVGPSQPLRSRDRNVDIESRILEVVEDNTIDDVVSDNMNQLFDLYKQGRLSDYESDDDSYVPSDGSTYHESDDEEGFWTDHWYQQNNNIKEPHHEGKNDQPKESSHEKNETRKDSYFHELSKNAKESFHRESDEPEHAFHQTTQESPANHQTSTSKQQNPRKSQKNDLLFSLVLIPLALGVIFTLLYVTSRDSLPHNPSFGTGIDSKIAKLNEITNDISKRQDFLETSQESLSKSINLRFETISDRFGKIENSIVGANHQFADLVSEFTSLRANASGVDEDKLRGIDQKLQQFANLESTVESLKSQILSQLISELPQHIPVYIKNKKIHFIPEFHKYLYTFLENYRNGTLAGGSWSQFLAQNKDSLDSYIEEKLGSSTSTSPQLKYLTKERLEAILKQKLSENNQFVFSRVNALVDRLDLSQVNGTSFGQATSGIVLSSLLEVFAKGSIKVNYADYTLGARILGFLTRLSMEGSKKSVLRRLFLGWNDYLRGVGTSSGLSVQKPQEWKFNANNAILDNDDGWMCQSHHCSIGIRLFNSVILTDVIINNKINSEKINPPSVISLYIKPKNLQQSTQLKEYISKCHLGNDDSGSSNKYLSKFVKINQVRAKSKLTHIKIPVSLVNLRINTRDIYIEIRGPKGSPVGITNVKAYGITELNAYKYQEELEFLLNQLDTDTVGQEEYVHMQDEVSNDLEIDFSDAWQNLSLGDDEII